MSPEFPEKTFILVQKLWFFCKLRIDDVVVLYDPRTGECIVKRIKSIEHGKYFVVGDNMIESTDSRKFGWISQEKIVGKVFYKLM